MSAAPNAAAPAVAPAAGDAAMPPLGSRLALSSDEAPIVSLRDLFAGLAMAGLWASGRRNTDEEVQPAQIARIAYETADAMLRRRRSG